MGRAEALVCKEWAAWPGEARPFRVLRGRSTRGTPDRARTRHAPREVDPRSWVAKADGGETWLETRPT
jgi:hypothetical protein